MKLRTPKPFPGDGPTSSSDVTRHQHEPVAQTRTGVARSATQAITGESNFPPPGGSGSNHAGGGLSAGAAAKEIESVGSIGSRFGAEECPATHNIRNRIAGDAQPSTSAEADPSAESLSSVPSHGAQGDPAIGQPGPHETAGMEANFGQLGRPTTLLRFGIGEEAVKSLQQLYLSTNRNADGGSYVEAVRLFAALADCPPPFRLWFAEEQRKHPHRIPPSLREVMAKAKPHAAWNRAQRRTELDRGLHGHGHLRYHETEQRRLYAGEVEVWDDGSVNFVCWVPWPWGGCRVSDKWGVKVGRFQLLAAIDAATSYCPGFSFVARPAQSYRAEDIAAAMVRLWGIHGKPGKLLLERGSWEARRVADLCAAADIEVRHTYTPRHKLIEPWFGRIWLRTSSEERVSLGRFRRDDEEGNRLYERLKSGSVDPRQFCQSLPELVGVLEKAILRSNAEAVDSRVYGTWIPAERWQSDFSAHEERKPLGRDLSWAHAPEIRDWTVRRSHVAGILDNPIIGAREIYAFSWADAWQCEGKQVRVHFDPAADLCRAAIVARENIPEAGARKGDLLTDSAESISDNATILPGGEIDWDGGAEDRTRRMLQAQRRARALEFRAFYPNGKRAAWASEVRGPDGRMAAVAVTPSASPAPIVEVLERRAARPDPTESDLAAIEAAEQRARDRGLIPAADSNL